METSNKTGYNARNVLIEAVKMLYADYLKYIEANPQEVKQPGKQKKGDEFKRDAPKNDGKKKGCF